MKTKTEDTVSLPQEVHESPYLSLLSQRLQRGYNDVQTCRAASQLMVSMINTKDIFNTVANMSMSMTLLRNLTSTPTKAHELLTSSETWCQESPAEDQQGNKLQAFDPKAVRWCALAAIQKTYPPSGWGEAMDRVLLALSFSEAGLAQMNKTDKACCLMEWNDDRQNSFQEIRGIFIDADI